MSVSNPFEPPKAAVADIVDARPWREQAIKLVAAGAIQILWSATWLPAYVELCDKGALHPIGLVFVALGVLLLCVGLARAFASGRRGHRLLFSAAVLSAAGLADWWRALPLSGALPIVLLVLVAGGSGLVVLARTTVDRAATGHAESP